MEFIFTTTVDNAICHMRSYQTGIDPAEVVSQRPHKHYYMEFHCVFSGEETIMLPDRKQEFVLKPGSILLLPRGVYHGATTFGKTVERLCFNFSVEQAADETGRLLSICRQITDPALIEDPQVYGYLLQCRQLRIAASTSFSHSRQGLLLLHAVLAILDILSPEYSNTHEEKSSRQRWVIEEHIEHHFADDSGLDGLAAELFLSTRQTRKLVRKFMGEDYKNIIIRRRMELAEIYLKNGNKTLEEIAWLVGYRSYSGFQLCFRQYFGITPSRFRKENTG